MTNKYPLSSKYPIDWIIENHMGSNCLILTEKLAEDMTLSPGMRVLDLGCGKALSSIFMAKEYGVHVTALDLRISPSDNWRRIVEANVSDLVFPVRGNALDLPFADEFFDAVVSINSIWSYGTADDFVDSQLARVVKPGGTIAATVPGFFGELSEPPEYLKPFWHPDFDLYHSPAWWRALWEKAHSVEIGRIDAFTDHEGVNIWRDFCNILDPAECAIFDADRERNITFLRLTANARAFDRNAT